jgi:hypothetical protein
MKRRLSVARRPAMLRFTARRLHPELAAKVLQERSE